MESPEDIKHWSAAALNWFAAGYISRNANPADPAARVCEAVKRWTAKYCGKLSHLNIGMVITCDPDQLSFGSSDYGWEDGDVESQVADAQCALATFGEGFDGYRVLEPRILKLEDAHRGLGQTAMHWLNRATWRVEAGVVSPTTLRDACSQHLWFGVDTQKDFAAEAENYYDDIEEEFDGLSPAVFDDAVPPWALKPKEVLKSSRLQRIAREDSCAGAVAKVVLELIRAFDVKTTFQPPSEMYPAVATTALRWNSEDATIRAIDDLDHQLGQCEVATDQLAITPIPLEAEQFKEWLDCTSSSLRIFNLLDQLIGLISVKENP